MAKSLPAFEGKWRYQSYRPDPASAPGDPTAPKFATWSPPGELTVDAGGATGKLILPTPDGPLELTLTIRVEGGSPGRVHIVGVKEREGMEPFTNELVGWFATAKLGADAGADNPTVVRGSIVQTSDDILPKEDLRRQPIYTTGYFVLVKA